jgi:hypothetical protein
MSSLNFSVVAVVSTVAAQHNEAQLLLSTPRFRHRSTEHQAMMASADLISG